ncbi:MAG: hypothetical protein IPN94_16710 [Sphingobacteriales bacterium]|nr:hypothetical protein [Sphingobacteriales bacterium]
MDVQTTVSATVSQPALALTVICTTTPNTASVTASGGTSPYDYLWSNGSTNSSISGLTGANYSVTVTDFNGCTAICGSYVPNFNPDFGATQVNVPLTGDVSTNDNQTPGSTYGNPPVNPSNPSGCAPIVASNGTYSFVCDTPGEYTFLVPVCEPSPSTVCTDVPLIITVIDPTIVTNAPIANPDYNTTLQDNPVTSVVLSNDQCQNGPTCTLSNPTIVTGPSVIGATAVVNPDGTITYNPAPGFVGVDSVGVASAITKHRLNATKNGYILRYYR